jgi:uncharacterized protein YecT (DUF1311 family)
MTGVFPLLGLTLLAALSDRAPEVEAACRRVEAVSVPPNHRPDARTAATLAGCQSEALYYGIGKPPDPERARQCAYLELDAGDQLVFGGSAMLMTIYANGVGAPRNLELAMKFACKVEGAPAEESGRLEHLAKLQRERWTGTNFHLCDDITSGFMGGHCAAHDQRKKQRARQGKQLALLAGFGPADRATYDKLRAAADKYFEARTQNEVDLSGTARAALQIEEQAALEKSFLAALEQLEKKKALPAKTGPLAEVDARLNVEYRRVMAVKEPVWGTVEKAGITKTQRSWLKYRDAFVAFARQRYASLPSDQIQAWLTDVRTAMLKEFGD